MARTPMYALVDKLFDGQLEAELRRMNAEHGTLDEMASEFRNKGFPLSRETIRRWLNELKIERPKRGAA